MPGAADFAGGELIAIDALPDAAPRGFYGNAPDLVIFAPPSGSPYVTAADATQTPFVSSLPLASATVATAPFKP